MSGMRDQSGTVMVEYALILALLALAFISGLKAVEGAASTALSNVQTNLNTYDLRAGNST
jgi:Flp pilus assembly pilin Flp